VAEVIDCVPVTWLDGSVIHVPAWEAPALRERIAAVEAVRDIALAFRDRPRESLLVALGLALVAALWLWPSAPASRRPSH
jgi:hypothetical protein